MTRPIRQLHARLDPDGQEPRENEPAEPRRELRLRQRRNRVDIDGYLDIETGLQLQALLDAPGKPRSGTGPRTTEQRHGDAFAEAIQLAGASENLPESGGEPFTILLTAAETALETGLGTASATDGTRIPAAQLQRIACDATVITNDGKHKRTAPPALRRALIARDQGCARPDCDRPPALCHAHHIQHHAHDGPTTLDNLVPLCGWHHRLLHHAGWAVHMEDGSPRFTPPGYRRIAA